jgi:hypothetical protein
MKREEAYIQNMAEAFLLRLGIPYLHLTTAIKRRIGNIWRIFPVEGMTGWPDLLIFLPRGRHLFVELKSEKGTISKDQRMIFSDLEAKGHRIEIIRSFGSFKDLIIENLGRRK